MHSPWDRRLCYRWPQLRGTSSSWSGSSLRKTFPKRCRGVGGHQVWKVYLNINFFCNLWLIFLTLAWLCNNYTPYSWFCRTFSYFLASHHAPCSRKLSGGMGPHDDWRSLNFTPLAINAPHSCSLASLTPLAIADIVVYKTQSWFW